MLLHAYVAIAEYMCICIFNMQVIQVRNYAYIYTVYITHAYEAKLIHVYILTLSLFNKQGLIIKDRFKPHPRASPVHTYIILWLLMRMTLLMCQWCDDDWR